MPKVKERVYLIKSTNPYHNCILEKNNLNWNTFSWGQKLASMIILVFGTNLMKILSLQQLKKYKAGLPSWSSG